MAAPAVKDPMEMDKAEFDQAVITAGMNPAPDDTNDSDPPPADPAPSPPANDPPEPVKPFTLDPPADPAAAPADPAAPPADPATPADTIEITHNGQVHRLTRDKVVELAQKGFDYDTKVGRHSRLAQLVEADSSLREVINKHLHARLNPAAPAPADPPAFKTRPMRENETEDQWLAEMLKDNLPAIKTMVVPPAPAPPMRNPTGQLPANHPLVKQVERFAQVVYARDFENAGRVLPQLDRFARQHLTLEQYQRVNSSTENLVKFYEWAKPQILRTVPSSPPPAVPPAQPAAPSFRTRPGGGQPPRQSGTVDVFDLPKEEFNKRLNKLKGY